MWPNSAIFLQAEWLPAAISPEDFNPSLQVTLKTPNHKRHCISRLLPGSEPETIRNDFISLPSNTNEYLGGLDLSYRCFSGGKTFLTWLQPMHWTSLPYWLYESNRPLLNLQKGWDLDLCRYCKSPKTTVRSLDCLILQGQSHVPQLFSKLSM